MNNNRIEHSTQPIYHLEANPPGWLNASLDVIRRTTGGDALLSRDILIKMQEQRWEQTTGVSPTESTFTVVLPIHNEANFLPSVLGTFMFADIPPTVNLQVIIVSNGCTDTSFGIIDSFMQQLGQLERKKTIDYVDNKLDPKLDEDFTQVRPKGSNWSVKHLNTMTSSKSNALNLANSIAIHEGHTIVMNLDGNTCPEPTAISRLFGAAHSEIVQKPSGAFVISGSYRDHQATSELIDGLTPKELLPAHLGSLEESGNAVGSLCCWNAAWFDEIGSLPLMSVDEGYLSRTSLYTGRPIRYVDYAYTWRYVPGLEGRKQILARYYQGGRQMIAKHPELEPIILRSMFYMNTSDERNKALEEWAAGDPRRLRNLELIKKIWEVAVAEGERLYEKGSISWTDVDGTK